MPEQPSPKDATEAALWAECWDAVLSYADLCTAGAAAAHELATEAFALGLREVRAADAGASRGRRTPRLPAIPLMLTAVRTTAAAWEAGGLGDRLDPDLRLWLNSDRAARYPGPPPLRPLALRGLRDLQEADAALLWLAEVEALPLVVVARRLGLDPATVSEELDQVRALFRDRCRRNHLDTPMDAECRRYARLLDAVSRSASAGEAPEDLSRHLATCVRCAEAAACLRPHGGGLPAALAGGVIGWGGLAYLERRRRAAEVRLGPPRYAPGTESADPPETGTGRARVVRGSLLAAAVALSALALTVSLMPFGGSASDSARGEGEGRPVADGGFTLPSADPSPHSARGSAAATAPASPSRRPSPSGSGTATGSGRADPDPEPQGTSSSTAATGSGDGSRPSDTPAPSSSAAPTCTVHYDLADQWNGGFQARVTVTTTRALDTWRTSWTFRDGQRITQMWDATVHQDGPRVTATAADYDRTVPAGGTLSFGFIASWHDRNSAPTDFALNARACTTT
ncbi:cellulose-binding domain-containing protein [Streptomyces sp. MK5]|uniref:cellulose-binding domain-containing protein n=1 Tax=Streptomyces sp. MK5 TaxID=3064253 RepID=UPI002741F3DC|nr:cellulose-binding domain-containing protein [Streptomyces sp. MK5]